MLSADSHLPFHFTVLSDEECLNDDDQLDSVHNAPEIQEPSPPSPQPTSAPVMRQRAVAHVVPISMPNVLREIAGLDPLKVMKYGETFQQFTNIYYYFTIISQLFVLFPIISHIYYYLCYLLLFCSRK